MERHSKVEEFLRFTQDRTKAAAVTLDSRKVTRPFVAFRGTEQIRFNYGDVFRIDSDEVIDAVFYSRNMKAGFWETLAATANAHRVKIPMDRITKLVAGNEEVLLD